MDRGHPATFVPPFLPSAFLSEKVSGGFRALYRRFGVSNATDHNVLPYKARKTPLTFSLKKADGRKGGTNVAGCPLSIILPVSYVQCSAARTEIIHGYVGVHMHILTTDQVSGTVPLALLNAFGRQQIPKCVDIKCIWLRPNNNALV